MGDVLVPVKHDGDMLLVKLAREIAIDHYGTETILKRHQITPEEWGRIKANPRFNELLRAEIEAWQAATNTTERTKLKAQALIEEWLPEANGRLHDPGENLPAKVELFKAIARIGGMDKGAIGVEGGGGERFSVTINLGADHQLKIEKDLPPRVIEAEATESM